MKIQEGNYMIDSQGVSELYAAMKGEPLVLIEDEDGSYVAFPIRLLRKLLLALDREPERTIQLNHDPSTL